ncbi:hypothetical protein OQJ19_04830 [Fluoribacter gormanii]|uniref:hypothetical protein n=1 Tax=Fluoribacter gormanii TaxID=464 RepID=UPI002242DAD8|nr:hypothetical protein [Fluoribacter gormanii]MCW8444772.1 hypothetical protein [Fluoribacter gormanii]MCW8469982.1 hypothetical protein [Fluoribacter gormanii]
MRKLFEKPTLASDVTTSMTHADICTCSMCMKSKLPTEVASRHLHSLQATMVDRRNPDKPGSKPLMKAVEAHAILKAGTEINMLEATGISKYDIPDPGCVVQITSPQELTIKATWKNKNQECAQSGRDANVFGGLGVLAIPSDVQLVNIPKMNARAVPRGFLAKYGAELIPLEQSFILDAVNEPSLENLYLVEYQWDADYIKDYVMKRTGGGGLFVETHPFPHVFTPLSPKCSGALILGVEKAGGEFDFAAFEIPFGYTMTIGSNVIHGDSFFVGPYAIALTETELADSVILKQDTPQRTPQKVVQTPAKTYTIGLYDDAKVHNQDFFQKRLSFFKRLPKEVLTEVRHLSTESQTAFDQQFGLVPYSS